MLMTFQTIATQNNPWLQQIMVFQCVLQCAFQCCDSVLYDHVTLIVPTTKMTVFRKTDCFIFGNNLESFAGIRGGA